jgi:protoporphyrin/coproporphyrin ferrochelatase
MDKSGILLINTGSPDSPSVSDVRRYLREFLMDGRVIDLPFPARAAIVYGCILPFRPRRSAEAYRQIWTAEGSPLVVTSGRLRDKLRALLQQPVELAMRYGNPSVQNALLKLDRAGVQRILVFPMYPHYAMSSYESAVLRVREVAAQRHSHLRIDVAPPYYDDPRYIDSLVRVARPQLDHEPDHVLFSFHGMPVRHLSKADSAHEFGVGPERERNTCYRYQSAATVRAFLEHSGWPEERASIGYQSRLGRDRWMEPHTHVEFERLARNGIRRLAVICPSFTVDCLETLEEIAIRGREIFIKAGGAEFTMVPALNEGDHWARAMARMAQSTLAEEQVLEPADDPVAPFDRGEDCYCVSNTRCGVEREARVASSTGQ